jgi:aminomethyltransferase
MVPFAGWEMPVEYRGILEEHRCVREQVGVFDVSHMGQISVSGPDATAFLRFLLPNDVSRMQNSRMLYSPMCRPDGGIIDDLMVLGLAPESYLLVVNAATAETDWQWIREQASGFPGCEAGNRSDEYAMLAVQGPRAEETLEPLAVESLRALDFLEHSSVTICGKPARISRSGYTGEDGFEILAAPEDIGEIWDAICAAGTEPIGLGARDTLRLEAGFRLYGSDMDRNTDPFEAGLGWTVKLDEDRDFIGAAALRERKSQGVDRRLVGLVLQARGVPRRHQKILRDGVEIGETTSGTFSPTRREGIALGYVTTKHRKPGTQVEIESRNRRLPAEVVHLPFVAHGTRSRE